MRQLGMKTVLPAFSGHIPDDIQHLFPNASISKSPNWYIQFFIIIKNKIP